MLLDHVDALDNRRALGGKDAQHLAFDPAVFAENDQHLVVLLDLDFVHGRFARYMTSGAKEMIFMNRFSRSSRATGPNTRVPTGSPVSPISTAELLSKRM